MATKKISAYARNTSLLDTDGIYIMELIDTVPVSKTMTILNKRKNLGIPLILTPPIDTDFTWTNQGGASLITTFGNAILIPGSASSSLRIEKKLLQLHLIQLL